MFLFREGFLLLDFCPKVSASNSINLYEKSFYFVPFNYYFSFIIFTDFSCLPACNRQ